MTVRPEPTAPAARVRLGAYALVVRDGSILLTRLASRVVDRELWTLPGGGVETGEDPNLAVVREVREETGLDVTVEPRAIVRAATVTRPDGTPAHSVRLVFAGRVPKDAPAPRVLEIDGSTADAAWHPVSRVRDGHVPVVDLVHQALDAHATPRRQRLAAYGLATRPGSGGLEILLTRVSPLGHHAGAWTLPGGGVDHGEPPAAAVAREVAEETGLRARVGDLLGVHDVHFTGTAPHGGSEDYHGVHLVFAVHVDPAAAGDDAAAAERSDDDRAGSDAPSVVEVGGTTDLAAWVPVDDVRAGRLVVLDLVVDTLARHVPPPAPAGSVPDEPDPAGLR
ncbi:NUDIX domain-containing protein [Agilicoccus flavus]|uniref:NUDIX domain-containing protein n=1 Tax=Agilicoccus flavus TaxID=2775968 RepID=UPI0027DA6D8B|nr:NUDIX domain-containing protein [Agilicoccus flavus]